MLGTTLRRKYGRPKFFENGIYYTTTHLCPVFDDDDKSPFVVGLRHNDVGPTYMIFHPAWLDDVREYFEDKSIKLIERQPPNPFMMFQEFVFDDD